jgi:hypothetical protein
MSISFSPLQDSKNAVPHDIFGISYDSTIEVYETIMALSQAGTDGIVTLPDGREVDMSTLTGMTVFQTYLNFLEAHKELIDNSFVFIKNLENKLDNLLSS